VRLIAVANSKHTWLKPDGISVASVNGAVPRPEHLPDLQGVSTLPKDAILGIHADILVLAALEDAVNEVTMHQVKAGILLELANGPVTTQAEQYLQKKHVTIIPDVVANAGGVVVSCFEWQQNVQHQKWDEQTVNTKLERVLVTAAQAMIDHAEQEKRSLKQAAVELALIRLHQTAPGTI